ncbi:MAG: hypothetical protein HY314_09930 [Acidobacteria bacterium]|nr:hypothetical protein [Acidobacteriota bacterium]
MTNHVANPSLQGRWLGIVAFLILLSTGCNRLADNAQPPSPPSQSPTAASTSTPRTNLGRGTPSPATPSTQPTTPASKALSQFVTPEDGPDDVVRRLGEPDVRGRWAAGETFLYFGKGMQVNLKDGKVVSLSLYDDGVVLKPGAPPFKKYRGSVDGVSLDSTVEQVLQMWGEPTNFYVRGGPGTQAIVMEYKDRATLTVWPLKDDGNDPSTFHPVHLKDLQSQQLKSITLYWAEPKK